VKVAERPSDELLARKSPFRPRSPGETIKPPDNVLASLRVQALDNAMMSQLNIPAKTTGRGHYIGGTRRTEAEAAGLQRGDVIQEVNHETVKTLEDYQKATEQD
jgi:serine protease Do